MKEVIKSWKVFMEEVEKAPEDLDVVVKIVLIDEDDKILVLTNEQPGYDLPGGHIREGESKDEGLIREVFEETGLKIEDFSRLDYSIGNKTFYRGPVPNKDVSLSAEHKNYDFLSFKDIKESGITRSFQLAIEAALRP